MLDIKIDSRKVEKGDIFVAINGSVCDGHKFVEDALRNGARQVIVEKDVGNYSNVAKVSSTKKFLENYLDIKYGHLIADLKIIGITGTNGKTTTTHFVYQMLQNAGIDCAMIGTLGFVTKEHTQTLVNTTPDIVTLYACLLEAVEKGCKVVVMEVSSIGLEQERLGKILFDVVAYLNLSLDHLDYHHTMEHYAKAKAKILQYRKNNALTLINGDDEYQNLFKVGRYLRIGHKGCEYNILNLYQKQTSIQVSFEMEQRYFVELPIIGDFNVYNYMFALAIAKELKVDFNTLIEVSKNIQLPKGRSNIIPLEKGYAVVDFAHTPDAIKNILLSFKENAKARIITVVGCGGNRDKSKRPIIGELASYHSDHVIFTSDNPRNEEVSTIIDEMTSSLSSNNYEIITDRSQAIAKGIKKLAKDDLLLILGKGHEQYQIIKEKVLPFSDFDCIYQNM